jgi:hypothetical protein
LFELGGGNAHANPQEYLLAALNRFPLPRHWGGGRTAIADGTHVKLHENNRSDLAISATATMAVSPITTSPTPTSPCSPASFPRFFISPSKI